MRGLTGAGVGAIIRLLCCVFFFFPVYVIRFLLVMDMAVGMMQ